MNTTLLSTHGLSVGIANRTLCQDLDLNLNPGKILAILGINGSGKTTLLHTLAGLRAAQKGEIRLGEQPLLQLSRRKIARQLGLLLQDHNDIFPITVLETARLGRHPWSNWWQVNQEAETTAANQTLKQLGLAEYASRLTHTLSGGERQRLAIATLLTQDPKIYLLDEPGNHLDIRHQMEVMELMTNHIRQQHATLAFSTHDLNLASRFADQVLLLFGDGEYLYGNNEEILQTPNLQRLYQHPVQCIEHQGQRLFFPE